MDQFMVVLSKVMVFVLNNYSDQIAYFIGFLMLYIIGYLISVVKNSYVKEALQHVYTAVQVVKQTVVDELKADQADGVLTEAEKTAVKETARKVFLEQFGIVGKFITTLCVGSLEKWFNTQVEVIVAEIKKPSSTKSTGASPQ